MSDQNFYNINNSYYSSWPFPQYILSNQYRLHISNALNSPVMYNSTYHHLTHLLKGHLGCVNTLNWSQNGQWLLSGSDDQCLLVHKYTPGDIRSGFKLKNKFQTAHTNNIFDAKFSPSREDRIVSVAADGRVCVIDDWGRRGWDELNTQTLIASPTADNAKRIEFLNESGTVFLVACEDGYIVQFDLREPKPSRNVFIDLAEKQVGVHSISKCPSAAHLLAVAGTDPFVRIYDLRVSTKKSAYSWTPPLKMEKTINFATGLRFSRFGYNLAVNYIKDGPYLIDPIYQSDQSVLKDDRIGKDYVKSTNLDQERRQWSDLTTFYNLKNFVECEKLLKNLIAQHRRLQNDPIWCKILAYEIFDRVLCFGQISKPNRAAVEVIKEDLCLVIGILDYWPARYLLVMFMISLGLIENSGIICENFLKEAKESNQWTQKIEQVKSIAAICELDPAQIPKLIPKDFAQACSEVPFISINDLDELLKQLISGANGNFNGYFAFYPGIIHERTIKGISFVGDSDQYIGVGSDEGCAFLLKTPKFNDPEETTKLPIWAAKSDNSIVNVVEGHPNLPVIAVSGIDNTVKIWQPEFIAAAKLDEDEEIQFKAYTTPEIPELMQNFQLRTRQQIHRIQINPALLFGDPSTLLFYLRS